jgi:hypothetical protein
MVSGAIRVATSHNISESNSECSTVLEKLEAAVRGRFADCLIKDIERMERNERQIHARERQKASEYQ